MADGFKKLSVQLFPEGVFKIGNSSRVDVAATILYFEEELTKLLRELEDEHKKLNALPSTKRHNSEYTQTGRHSAGMLSNSWLKSAKHCL